MSERRDPFLAPDDDAREVAASLLSSARTAALAVLHPAARTPYVTLIALRWLDGAPVTLVSDLSIHTQALRADPKAGLLISQPPEKGDPLNAARLSLSVTARFVTTDDPQRPAIRDAWRAAHPKSVLYIDFADFHFVRFDILGGHLNGGFARAFALTAQDLKLS